MADSGLTEELTEDVAKLVRSGMDPARAAAVQGVERATFDAWMSAGAKSGRGLWRQQRFRLAMIKAEAQAESVLVLRVAQAARSSWQAAAWLAERRWPERFVRRSVNAEDGGASLPLPVGSVDPFADLDNVEPIDGARRRRRGEQS